MKGKNCSLNYGCTYRSNSTPHIHSNGNNESVKKSSTTDNELMKLRLRRITDIYIYCMLLGCIFILIFVFSQPFTEKYLIRLIFGESSNYCNYTYIPSINNYRRPYKVYN
ncbi:unnamed protein product [Heterobilharzia americana]|nr:unnamed protein product [Heterobilharzia americana]CAH8476401.1 unnamed protein product [Heterobilharzia americana]